MASVPQSHRPALRAEHRYAHASAEVGTGNEAICTLAARTAVTIYWNDFNMSSTSQVNRSIVGSSPTDTTLPVRMATKAGLYGSIEPNGNNWRAALKIGGMYSKGPTRAAREEAVEDLRALNLARPCGRNAVATCARALQAIASAQRQARSASSTSQCGRSKEPSSQSTAVRANPSVGLVSMGPKRRRSPIRRRK